jgi:hypothetical protein
MLLVQPLPVVFYLQVTTITLVAVAEAFTLALPYLLADLVAVVMELITPLQQEQRILGVAVGVLVMVLRKMVVLELLS